MKRKLSLEELHSRADITKEKLLSTTKARYKLARGLGFTSYEAQVLMSQSEETIRRLAKEKQAKE